MKLEGKRLEAARWEENAYIIGFLQNFTPGTEMAINQKLLDIF